MSNTATNAGCGGCGWLVVALVMAPAGFGLGAMAAAILSFPSLVWMHGLSRLVGTDLFESRLLIYRLLIYLALHAALGGLVGYFVGGGRRSIAPGRDSALERAAIIMAAAIVAVPLLTGLVTMDDFFDDGITVIDVDDTSDAGGTGREGAPSPVPQGPGAAPGSSAPTVAKDPGPPERPQRLSPGGDASLVVEQDPSGVRYGTLTLDLQPPDASVTLPDFDVSYRPGVRLPAGRHRVLVRRFGYSGTGRTVEVSGDTRVRIELEVPPDRNSRNTSPTRRSSVGGAAEAPTGRPVSDEGLNRASASRSSLAAPLRRSAGALAERSATGFATLSSTEGWMAEYNRLVREVKSAFPDDSHVQALETLSHMGSDQQAAGAVTTAAEGLEMYLESFESRDAFRSSAVALAKRSATGFVNLSNTEGWMAEYNRLIGEARSVLPEDPHLRALKKLSHMGSDQQAAGAVTTAAEGLEMYLESFESRDAFRSSAVALAKRSATGFVNLSNTEGWMAEYNRLVGEARSVFPQDPRLRALETLSHMGNDRKAAAAVTAAARKLAGAMGIAKSGKAPASRTVDVTGDKASDRPGGRSLAVGETFRDSLRSGGSGPEMVVIPAGRFRMGCPKKGERCPGNEKPPHEVRIGKKFALGRYEVTVGEFRHFAEATGYLTDAEANTGTGCRTLLFLDADSARDLATTRWVWTVSSWRRPGFRLQEMQPAVCVSWRDAEAYASWLSDETGMPYRLPSEAEWEYSARAGSTTPYHFGDAKGDLCAYGNVRSKGRLPNGNIWLVKADCSDGALYPVRVGGYRPNAWGLYDMHGNVREWVADCWNGSYDGAPPDGGARQSGDCSHRVLRGGSWHHVPRNLRSATRFKESAGYRDHGSGFRVARTLAP